MKTQRVPGISVWWIVSVGATAAIVLLTISPVLLGPVAGIPAYAMFSSVCHQIIARSFDVGGVTFAVCQRCFGLYTGFLAGMLTAYPLRAKHRGILGRTLWLVALPVLVAGIEWTAELSGAWIGSPWSRSATGAAIGMSVGVAIGLMLLTTNVSRLRSRKERRHIQTTRTTL
jgi:uncharacterized membrane protein